MSKYLSRCMFCHIRFARLHVKPYVRVDMRVYVWIQFRKYVRLHVSVLVRVYVETNVQIDVKTDVRLCILNIFLVKKCQDINMCVRMRVFTVAIT